MEDKDEKLVLKAMLKTMYFNLMLEKKIYQQIVLDDYFGQSKVSRKNVLEIINDTEYKNFCERLEKL